MKFVHCVQDKFRKVLFRLISDIVLTEDVTISLFILSIAEKTPGQELIGI